jgi:hypothetical protein
VAKRVLGIVVAAALFGAADLKLQRTGGNTGFWLSNMSAFWLLLPFLAGRWMPTVRSAAIAGLVTTFVALGAFYSTAHAALPAETWMYVVGGLVTGPLFGVLGRRWGAERWLPGAVALAAAFCCEPLAWRRYKGYLPAPTYVWRLETLAGVLLAGWFLLLTLRRRIGD